MTIAPDRWASAGRSGDGPSRNVPPILTPPADPAYRACTVAGCADPTCRHRRAADRFRRRARLRERFSRRRAARQLDQLLGGGYSLSAYPGGCDGDHHPGSGCDWWGPCTGAAYTLVEARRLRAGMAA